MMVEEEADDTSLSGTTEQGKQTLAVERPTQSGHIMMSQDGADDLVIPTKKGCCAWAMFQEKKKAQGFAFAATGHGCLIMSNVFLSTSFTFLAHEEVGCIDEETKEIIKDCNERVYGFSPDSLITNIATIAAVLAALLLPVVGAVIDYTPHRRRIGQIVAVLLFCIQSVQIGTTSKTWFPMAILQAIVIALYEMHYSLSSSYLQDVSRYDVDAVTFNSFNRTFYGLQFGGEVVYLFLVVAISTVAGFDSVTTAQVAQAIGSVWLLICFSGTWKRFPDMPQRHNMPPGHTNIFLEGFRQNWRTSKAIYGQSKTLLWFYIAVVVGEAGTSALLPVVLNLLANVLKYDGAAVGIAFLLALAAALPGVAINAFVSQRTNPVISVALALLGAGITTICAMLTITGIDQDGLGRAFSFFWGLFLGWWYAGEQLLFGFLLPAGQESELSGFFVYCTIVLTWVSPLIYSIMVENDIQEKYGLASLICFQVLGILALRMIPKWEEAINSAKQPLLLEYNDDSMVDETTPIANQAEGEPGKKNHSTPGSEGILAASLQPTDGEKSSSQHEE